MFRTSFFFCAVCFTLLVTLLCDDGGPSGPGVTANVHGVFIVTMDGKTTGASIAFKNGKTPQKPSDTVMSEENLHLLEMQFPSCEPGCGSNALCIGNNNCDPYPARLSVGDLNVTGIKKIDNSTSFTIKDNSGRYSTKDLAYPLAGEGDAITITAAGKDSVASFTLSTVGIAPLVMLTGSSVLCETDMPVELRWEPPSKSIGSKVQVEVDMSYHGTTVAQIVGDCPDNGSLTISGALLNKLKSYDINGFPRIVLKRYVRATCPDNHVEVIIESATTTFLDIPGVKSCFNVSECDPGQTCVNRRCR